MLTVASELVGHLVALTTAAAANQGIPVTPAPSDQSRSTAAADPQSSPVPHETDIPNFLDYAERKLGVAGARSHESAMSTYRYGPDILPQVPDEKLEEIGLARGDILRMKKGSIKWFHGPERKRKFAETRNATPESSHGMGQGGGGSPTHRPAQRRRTRYEIFYPDGGAMTWHAPGPTETDGEYVREGEIFYCVNGVMVPLPLGYEPGRNLTDDEA